jgi:hypothetical protein
MPRRLVVLVALLALAGVARADDWNGRRGSVAPVGDVDGDGVPDFALALRSDDAGDSQAGLVVARHDPRRVQVLSGRTGERRRWLTPPGSDDPGFGRALEDLGDVDGDGWRDLAVAGSREVWILRAKDGATLHRLGGGRFGERFGRTVAGGGDVDGDGHPDVVVLGEERVFVFSGKSGMLLRVVGCGERGEWPDEARYVRVPADRLLSAVGLLDDLDGDGAAELALTIERAEDEDPARELLVLDGARGEPLRRIELPESGSHEPWIVRCLPDVDGDEVPEILLSIIHDHVLVYSGASGEELHRRSWVGGYLCAEGSTLAVVGDVDGDGAADYAVGANEDSIDHDPGFAEVDSGRTGARLRSLHPRPRADGERSIGVDVAALGDANGDGVPDLVVHLPRLREARVLSGADFAALLTVDLRVR